MRPAWSIIFFTTISGLGLGLAGWIVIGLLPLMTPGSVMAVDSRLWCRSAPDF